MIISRKRHTFNRCYYYLEEDDGEVLFSVMYWETFRKHCNSHGMKLPPHFSNLNPNTEIDGCSYAIIDNKYGYYTFENN